MREKRKTKIHKDRGGVHATVWRTTLGGVLSFHLLEANGLMKQCSV